MIEVHILAGNIGSGKTTTSNRITNVYNHGEFYYFSNDEIVMSLNKGYHGVEIYDVNWKPVIWDFKRSIIQFAIKSGLHLVLDDTHMGSYARIELIETARKVGDCHIIVHWHEHPDELKRRISHPRNQSSAVWQMVWNMHNKIKILPSLSEGMDELVYYDGDGDEIKRELKDSNATVSMGGE